MEIDALKIALLAAGAPEDVHVPGIHGELEHWLDRQLGTDELDAAVGELQSLMLVAMSPSSDGRVMFRTTDAGRAIVAARWEEFFPE